MRLTGVSPKQRPIRGEVFQQALELYDRGLYDSFTSLVSSALNTTAFDEFDHQAKRWISETEHESESEWRRTIVAAAVALEVAHVLREEPADRAGRYLAWASAIMRRSRPTAASDTERLWYLAAIAGMEELDEPWVLTAGATEASPSLGSLSRSIGKGGQLQIAVARFPEEPRFRLAEAEFAEIGVPFFAFTPSFRRFAEAHAKDHVREDGPWEELGPLFLRNQAATLLADALKLSEARRAFLGIQDSPGLRPEVELHLGYLESGAMNWASALQHFARVNELTDDPYLLYLSYYFVGLTRHRMTDHAAAAAAFQRALNTVPRARSAATQLAAELLLSDRADDFDRAYAVLQSAYTPPVPRDPWRLYQRGDARLWEAYMARLRAALR